MKQAKILMGMPISIEIIDKVSLDIFQEIFNYFQGVDEKFSPYKNTSEVSRINLEGLKESQLSKDMKEILEQAEKTKKETDGYFNIFHNSKIDPSGIVKGWAINEASKILKKKRIKNFYIEAGGDIQVSGKNLKGENWKIGIINPFNQNEIIKVLQVSNEGIATSGTYIRGQHIYNPFDNSKITDIVSLTVIGENIYDADRFATAAFAMGKKGILFVEDLNGLEGYMIDKNGLATFTSGFEKFVI